jgi:hypothetical protein
MKNLPPQVVITTDADPEAWGATLQIVKNNRFFNLEKEIRKLTLTEILQSTITEDNKIFCPTNILRSKRKTKTPKRISSSPTKME